MLPDIAAAPHLPDDLPSNPFPTLVSWFEEAAAKRVQPNPNAMTLATATADGRPSGRIVLCKAIEPEAGYVVFYTNYQGKKGQDLEANPRASCVFFWDVLDRQARVEGLVVRCPAEESDAYFASRPLESRIGAWASDQSRPVESRAAMAERVAATMRRFGLEPGRRPSGPVEIPRPPHWGGYRVYAERVELWVSGPGRVHDRAEWTRALTRQGDGYGGGPWSATRLQP